MGAIYDNDFYDDKPLTLDEPLRFPRIGYDNVVTEANVLGSTSLAGFPADSVGNALTYELWKPSELPATLDIDAGAPVTADYVAFGAHNLAGCRITLSYSTDGSTYSPAIEGVVVRNKAGMMLFEPVTARYWRLDILGWATSPTLSLDFVNRVYAVGDYTEADGTYLGVLYLGRALQMERGIYQGHTPGEFARNDEIRPSVSEGGQWLGRTVVRKGYDTSYSFSNLRADWVRSTLAPFLDAAVTDPFFIAWRPETKADEVLLGWTQGPIVPTNSGPRDLMSVDFNVSAHGEQEPAADKFTAGNVAYDVALDLAVQSTKWVYNAEGTLVEVPAGEPAYQHDPVTGEPLGQLIEEQRTNEFLQSTEFSATEWATDSNDITVTPNDGPELISGKLADRVDFNSTGSRLSQAYSGEFQRANSFLVRYISGDPQIRVFTQVNQAVFNVQDGAVVSGNGTIQPGKDGFYRCTLVATAASSRAALRTDTQAGAYHVAHAQLEQGAFPTSPIVTQGSQVTRLADNCSRTLGAELNASEWALYFEAIPPSPTSGLNIGFHDGSTANRYAALIVNNLLEIRAGASSPRDFISVPVELIGVIGKYALRKTDEELALFVNGSKILTLQDPPDHSVSFLGLGSTGGGVLPSLYGTVRLFPRALSEAELIALTTPEAE